MSDAPPEIWKCSAHAWRRHGNGGGHRSFYPTAASKDEAATLAMQAAKMHWPEADWTGHAVTVLFAVPSRPPGVPADA